MNQTNESKTRSLLHLTIGALGIVYGDIGTSPLYSIRQCFNGVHGLAVTEHNVLGIMSLIFWALVVVISLKYLMFVLNADNNGEGGVLALVALAFPKPNALSKANRFLLVIGLFGAALLFGDGIITPAISVLSAVEGLTIAAPAFEMLVLPLTVLLLFFVFFLQKYGTSRVGRTFGPIILLWFGVLAVLGIYNLAKDLRVLHSLNPYYAFSFFAENGWHGFVMLGTVFLVVTGGEALYADMGHFGKTPIRMGWFWVVFPALVLNYFGQGALLLSDPTAAENPFFRLVPESLLYPIIALATMSTIIASQAVISGTFSLTHQAVQLGYLPRLNIIHTNAEEKGQIYVPSINWLLLAFTVSLVLFFKDSTNLAPAYGVAITCTMVVTTILASLVARRLWGWRKRWIFVLTVFFLLVDGAFFAANLPKIPLGGWFALAIAAGTLIIMMTWKRGRQVLFFNLRSKLISIDQFLRNIDDEKTQRVKGVAVFLSSLSDTAPLSMLRNIKHNKIVHETTILMTVIVEDVPRVPWSEKFNITDCGKGIYLLRVRYGFTESVHIPEVFERCNQGGLKVNPSEITYFVGRETLVVSDKSDLSKWERIIFEVLTRNAQLASRFFRLPPDQVFEIGTQVEL